jgi:hypothetical protein
VVTGADGHRLHEEVVAAGLPIAEPVASARLNVSETQAAVAAARGTVVPGSMRGHLAAQLQPVRAALLAALEARGRERAQSLARIFSDRADRDADAITEVLSELKRTIEDRLTPKEEPQLTLWTPDERLQLERDTDVLRERLSRIPEDIERETAAIRHRYSDPQPWLFPVMITLLVPEGGALS